MFWHAPNSRALIGWLGLTGLLGALLAPAAVASADALTSWTGGPGAILDNT
ncbi:MAG: hypothetical protein LC797_07650 [Chloroflexi bacterium]|nr:hypothetical protein [Chloroflexota bacterium]